MAHVKEALESFNKSHASAQEHDKKLILRTQSTLCPLRQDDSQNYQISNLRKMLRKMLRYGLSRNASPKAQSLIPFVPPRHSRLISP